MNTSRLSHIETKLKFKRPVPDLVHVKTLYVSRKSLMMLSLSLVFLSGCSASKGGGSSSLPSGVVPAGTYSATRSLNSTTNIWMINYSLTLPTDPSAIDHINLREIDTTITTTVNCTVGVPVLTWNSPFTANQVISGSYMSGTQNKFRYVTCITGADNSVAAYPDVKQ